MRIEGLKIAFLGDSITEGAGVSIPDNIYHQVLKKNTNPKEAYNYGIGGTRIARQSIPSKDPNYDKYFATRIDDMEHDCDVVVVFGDTNDYGHGDAPFGNFDERRDDTFCGALHLFYKSLLPNILISKLYF